MTLALALLLVAPVLQDPAAPPEPRDPAVAAEAAPWRPEDGLRHQRWDALLKEFVHPGGLVDYEGLLQRRADLEAYLDELRAVTPEQYRSWTPAAREAFWVNAYDAWTVWLVLDHWPVDSIKDIGGWFSSVFDERFIPLQDLASSIPGVKVKEGKELSLGEVEHGILARVSRLPLFHFAIVCASRSCPPLRAEAYVGPRLDEQLAEQARIFLADPEKNDQRIEGNRLRVSKIFDWAEDELERYPGGIRMLLADFGPPSVEGDPRLADVRLRYRSYDWSLNAWKPEN